MTAARNPLPVADGQLDNSKLGTTQPVYVSSAELSYPSEAEREKALAAVKTGHAHRSLVDFDDYLDDS